METTPKSFEEFAPAAEATTPTVPNIYSWKAFRPSFWPQTTLTFIAVIESHTASATFNDDFHVANVKNQERMIQMAGYLDHLIPSHDAVQFQKYSPQGRVATLKPAK